MRASIKLGKQTAIIPVGYFNCQNIHREHAGNNSDKKHISNAEKEELDRMIDGDLSLQSWYYNDLGNLSDEIFVYFREDIINKYGNGKSIYCIEWPRMEGITGDTVINGINQYGPFETFQSKADGWENYAIKSYDNKDNMDYSKHPIFMSWDATFSVGDEQFVGLSGLTDDYISDSKMCLNYWYKTVNTYNNVDYSLEDYPAYPNGYPVTRLYVSLSKPNPKVGATEDSPYNAAGWSLIDECPNNSNLVRYEISGPILKGPEMLEKIKGTF